MGGLAGFRPGHVWLVALYDMKESLRSRRAWTIALLYFVSSLVAAWLFVKVMVEIERASAIVGGRIDPAKLAHSKEFRDILTFFGGSAKKVDYLIGVPPLGLFVVGIMLITIPWFVALTASDLVAGDVQQKTVRYILLRTGRINFVIGKVLAQAITIALTTLTALIPGTLFALSQLKTFDLPSTMLYLAEMTPALFGYALAFVGLAALASQLVSTTGKARSLALVMFVLLWLLGFRTPGSDSIWSVLAYLSPWQCRGLFFEPELVDRLTGVALSLGFSAAFTAIGLVVFARRDV